MQRTYVCKFVTYFQRKQKTDRMNLSVYSGIGIRTPTYRVRVCCATFTQYRYLYLVREAIP